MIPDDPTRFDGDPTPQEIADLAAEIRAGWTDAEHLRRSTFFEGGWQAGRAGLADCLRPVETPVIALADLGRLTN